jgi:Tripartite tricarboxylate transporter TctB family
LKIKNYEDFWSGVMFLAIGALAMWESMNYPFGTASRMGPGYFPTCLGGIMAVLGTMVGLKAIEFSSDGEHAKPAEGSPFAWKALIMLSLGFVFFGWGVDRIGFIPSLFGLTVITAAAGTTFNIKEILIMSVLLIAGAVGVFIYGVELPIPLFWWR